MRYASVGRKRQGRLTATALSGGLNRRELPFAVADDQLTDCRNLWWRDGVLRSRPALRAVETAASDKIRRYAAAPDGRYLLATDGAALTTGVVGEDGTVAWNTDSVAVGDGWRARYDVTRLDGWSAGEGDGTILFLPDGRAVAPLAAGGYVALDDFVYVPQLLAGGKGVPSLLDTPPAVTWFEQPNLLTAAFRAGYTTDGEGKLFYLSVDAVDSTYPIVATYRDADGYVTTHTVAAGETQETEAGADGLRMVFSAYRRCVYFVGADTTEMVAPAAAGLSDNLTVTAYAVTDSTADAAVIGQMRFGCWFGGESSGLIGGTRLFVAGNPACPHRVYWSDTERPLYFPQENYAAVGDASQAVTAFGKQDEMLVIFKEHELYAATYETQAVSAADFSGARFAITPLHGEIGCDCPATVRLCQNRLVWLSSEGRAYTLVSGNAYSACNVRAVSAPIEPLLRAVSGEALKKASAGYYRGWYCLLAGEELLLLCCDGTASRGDAAIWYRWTFDEAVEPERVISFADSLVLIDTQGRSYLFGGTKDTVVVNGAEEERDIPCSLCTKQFDFGHPDRRKTVRELVFTIGAEEDGVLSVTYHTDRGQRRECRRFAVSGEDERAADFLRTCCLTPHATRVRRFGVEIAATGAAAFGSLILRYDIDNVSEKGVG